MPTFPTFPELFGQERKLTKYPTFHLSPTIYSRESGKVKVASWKDRQMELNVNKKTCVVERLLF
jgi:hypothetical protein